MCVSVLNFYCNKTCTPKWTNKSILEEKKFWNNIHFHWNLQININFVVYFFCSIVDISWGKNGRYNVQIYWKFISNATWMISGIVNSDISNFNAFLFFFFFFFFSSLTFFLRVLFCNEKKELSRTNLYWKKSEILLLVNRSKLIMNFETKKY